MSKSSRNATANANVLSRRQFVQRSMAASVIGGTSMQLPALLAQTDTAPPHILLVYCSGGWDTTMVFDPHIGESLITSEPGASIAKGAGDLPFVNHSDRPSVQSFFNTYGAGTAIVNGLYSKGIQRETALQAVYGATPVDHRSPVDWLTFYAAYLNALIEMPSVFIEAPFMPGSYAPYAVRLTQELIAQYAGELPASDPLSTEGAAALKTWQADAFKSLTTDIHPKSRDFEKLAALSGAYQRHPQIASRLTQIQTDLGAQGTESNLLRHGKIATELFKRGLTQTAAIQMGAVGEWDTRTANYSQQSALFESLFAGLADIFAYAQEINILSRMTVIVISERGREPRLGDDAGKGPWPFTSALVYGAGIKGGQVIGSTDGALRGVPINPLFGGSSGTDDQPLLMENIMAALYLQYGVPSSLILGPETLPLAPLLAETGDSDG